MSKRSHCAKRFTQSYLASNKGTFFNTNMVRRMHQNITISAIVPAYNVEEYIVEAVESLLQQSDRFHEIILIDDGSTDNTPSLLDKYATEPGVIVLHIKNAGQGNARNLGLKQASGEYVYFFDADDILDHQFVTSIQQLVNTSPSVEIIYFSGESFLSPGCTSEFRPTYARKINQQFESGIEATGAMLRSDVYFAQPCLYVSKTALWRKNNLSFLSMVHEDEELILRLSCCAKISLCVDRVFFKRRIRSGSIMTGPKSQLHATGYLETLKSSASYCSQHWQLIAPIRRELIRRFYNILDNYLTLCKKVSVQPQYKILCGLVLKLGRPPSLRQMYELTVTPASHQKFSRIKRRICGQPKKP
ncbi:MAG: glycosyltransferase family 2 protein [Pseudomonadota bacterium]